MERKYDNVMKMMTDVLPDDPDFVIDLADQIIQRQAGIIVKQESEIKGLLSRIRPRLDVNGDPIRYMDE